MDLLSEILRTAGSRAAPNLDLLVEAALECAANAHKPAMTDDRSHAEFVRQAYEAALRGQWERAGHLLRHQHGMEREADPMNWPNYPVLPDGRPAWEILNEIVFRAHLDNPPNLDVIVRLAFKCAANDHLVQHQLGPNPPPTPLLDQCVITALARAKLHLWDLVADELNHD